MSQYWGTFHKFYEYYIFDRISGQFGGHHRNDWFIDTFVWEPKWFKQFADGVHTWGSYEALDFWINVMWSNERSLNLKEFYIAL